MSPGEFLLAAVDLSRGGPSESSGGGPSAWDEHETETFLRMARHHRVEGLVLERLASQTGPRIPAPIEEALRRSFHGSKLRHVVFREEWIRIAGTLRGRGIDCMPLKGIDIAHTLYPDPGIRPCDDIDLLVREGDAAAAGRALRDLGYESPRTLLPPAIVKRFHFHLLVVHTAKQIPVEIHWGLMDRGEVSPRATQCVWDQAQRDATGLFHMSPVTQAAYLAAHAGRHGVLSERIARDENARSLVLHPFSGLRLIWFVDLYLAMTKHGLSADDVLGAADALGCRASAHETLTIGKAIFGGWPGPVPALDPAGREGWLEDRIKNRLVGRIQSEQRPDQPFRTELPWVLTTNKRFHFRPIRLIGGRG